MCCSKVRVRHTLETGTMLPAPNAPGFYTTSIHAAARTMVHRVLPSGRSQGIVGLVAAVHDCQCSMPFHRPHLQAANQPALDAANLTGLTPAHEACGTPGVLGDADRRPRRRLGRRAGPPAAALAHLYDGCAGDQKARQDQRQTAERGAEAESEGKLIRLLLISAGMRLPSQRRGDQFDVWSQAGHPHLHAVLKSGLGLVGYVAAIRSEQKYR